MAKYKYIPVDIYKRGIIIFIGSHKIFENWISDYYKNDEDNRDLIDYVYKVGKTSGDACFWYNSSTGTGVIELRNYPETPKEIAVVAHECLHAVFHILDYCGVTYNESSGGESHTYLLEYILNSVLDLDNYIIV